MPPESRGPAAQLPQATSIHPAIAAEPGVLQPQRQAAARPSRILLFATLRWPLAGRLAMAFTELGCEVDALCPHHHPVTLALGTQRWFDYSPFWPQKSLEAALAAAAPDLVIPCDDDAAYLLSRYYEACDGPRHAARPGRELIERSLGMPSACTLAIRRGCLISLAAEEGIRTPPTGFMQAAADLHDWGAHHGYPVVLKADHSWGGQGVAVVRGADSIDAAGSRLMLPPGWLKLTQRMLLDRDVSPWLWRLRRQRPAVIAQEFIVGAPANRAVACWQGQVLAGISVEAVTTLHATGPAAVVRVMEDPEMSAAAERLVRRLGLSGLWGFDFVLEAGSGIPYLIEVNPRATPVCHLALGPGHDLPAALLAALHDGPAVETRPPQAAGDLIAMFPGEWQRDPASPFLRRAYHDVPWEEVAFIRDCLDRPWSERGWLFRLKERMRPRPRATPESPACSLAPPKPLGNSAAPDPAIRS